VSLQLFTYLRIPFRVITVYVYLLGVSLSSTATLRGLASPAWGFRRLVGTNELRHRHRVGISDASAEAAALRARSAAIAMLPNRDASVINRVVFQS
jgi:hypothetical protein